MISGLRLIAQCTKLRMKADLDSAQRTHDVSTDRRWLVLGDPVGERELLATGCFRSLILLKAWH